MAIIHNTGISNVKLGSTQVQALYHGDKLIWPTTAYIIAAKDLDSLNAAMLYGHLVPMYNTNVEFTNEQLINAPIVTAMKTAGYFTDDVRHVNGNVLLSSDIASISTFTGRSYDADGNVTSEGVFSGNTEITHFETFGLFKNLKNIPSGAFAGCSNLKEIWLPDATEKIGDYAFTNCTALDTVHALNTV